MHSDLQNLLFQLDQVQASGVKSKHSQKTTKADEKKRLSLSLLLVNQIQKAVLVHLKPQTSLRNNLYFLSDNGLLCLSDPNFKHDKILGSIPGSFFSYAYRVGLMSFNFEHKYLSIQMELLSQDHIPLNYAENLYQNFGVVLVPRALQVIQKCKVNLYHKQTDKHPFLYEQNWMDYLLDNEQLPAFVQRISCIKDKPSFEFVYNENYMKLAGVLPNIIMDGIMQSQQLPEIADTKDLQRWNDMTEGFLDAHVQQSVINEYKSMVVTYEGIKVGVNIKEIYLHTYCEKLNCHYYVRKITYQINNPRAYSNVFDLHRISRNSIDYLQDNKIDQKNQTINSQFLLDTNYEAKAQYQVPNPCGYKMKLKV